MKIFQRQEARPRVSTALVVLWNTTEHTVNRRSQKKSSSHLEINPR